MNTQHNDMPIRPEKLRRARQIASLSDAELNARLAEPAGLDRLLDALLDLPEQEEQDAERWDGLS